MQLVTSVAGAFIGSFFGPLGTQIGWALGSMVGGYLFAETIHQEGPRLESLKVTISSYGAALPEIDGTMRVGSNLIWATDLIEVATTEDVGGGKGGPQAEVTTYAYYGNFQFAICRGPAQAVRRVWFNDELVLDHSDTNDGAIARYPNTFFQQFTLFTPPILSMALGFTSNPLAASAEASTSTLTRTLGSWILDGFVAGQVVKVDGFTGDASANNAYFTVAGVDALSLTVFGSLIDAATTEGVTVAAQGNATGTENIRIYLGTEDQLPDPLIEQYEGVGNVSANRGIVTLVCDRIPLANYGNGVPQVTVEVIGFAGEVANGTAPRVEIAPPSDPKVGDVYVMDGDKYIYDETTTTIRKLDAMTGAVLVEITKTAFYTDWCSKFVDETPCALAVTPAHFSVFDFWGIAHGYPLVRAVYSLADGCSYRTSICKIDPDTLLPMEHILLKYGINGAQLPVGYRVFGNYVVFHFHYTHTTKVYGEIHVLSFSPWETITSYFYDGTYPCYYPKSIEYVGGTLYAFVHAYYPSGNTTENYVDQFTLESGTLLSRTKLAYMTAVPKYHQLGQAVATDGQYFYLSNGYKIDVGTLSGAYHAVLDQSNVIYRYGYLFVGSFVANDSVRVLDPDTLTDILSLELQSYDGGLIALGDRYLWGIHTETGTGYDDRYLRWLMFGVPQGCTTFADIVRHVAADVGLSDTYLNLDDVETLAVCGFVAANRQAARQYLEQLMSMYFVDAVESDGKIKFVQRGKASVRTIDMIDLGADEGDAKADRDLIRWKNTQEVELPREVELSYQNNENNYQVGMSRAKRQCVTTREKVSLAMPMATTDLHASAIVNKMIEMLWMESIEGEAYTTRDHLDLEPTDVVVLQGDTEEHTVILRKVEDSPSGLLKLTFARYDASLYSRAGVDSGKTYDQDIIHSPPVTQGFAIDVPRVDCVDAGAGVYLVATALNTVEWAWTVFASTNGIDWTTLVDLRYSPAAGYLYAAPPTDAKPNMWDAARTLTVKLFSGARNLSSESGRAVRAGANTAVIGRHGRWVVIKFKTVTQNPDGTFTLSDIAWGERGTDAYIQDLVYGDYFVMLTHATWVPLPDQYIGGQLSFLFVPHTYRLIDGYRDVIAFKGESLKPYPPAWVRGERDGSDNLTATWVRRARVGEEMPSGRAIQLGEAYEKYDAEAWSADWTTKKRTWSGLTSPTLSYTAADQTTDFGAPQSSINFKLYQISDRAGRGREKRATL